jgi:hypothetical protein
MYILLFMFSRYGPCYLILLLLSYAMNILPLQLLLLNLGEDGKIIIGGPLAQKKILMLCDGNSASSCCNLENIRYKIFLLGKFRL